MMSRLYNYIERIKDELRDAKYYAQKYVEWKNVNSKWAGLYHQMAMDELTHASNLSTMARAHYDLLSWKPDEIEADWTHCQAEIAEQTALVKMMLAS